MTKTASSGVIHRPDEASVYKIGSSASDAYIASIRMFHGSLMLAPVGHSRRYGLPKPRVLAARANS